MNGTSGISSTILVIDNDPQSLTCVASVLKDAGHTCHCAPNLATGAAAVQRLPIDLIIASTALDGIPSREVCRQLIQLASPVGSPLMFLSPNQTPDVVRRTELGVGCYHLRKPVDAKLLCELVDQAMWMPHLVRSNLKRIAQPSHSPKPLGLARVLRKAPQASETATGAGG